jgi:hypothetical protein
MDVTVDANQAVREVAAMVVKAHVKETALELVVLDVSEPPPYSNHYGHKREFCRLARWCG